MASWWLRIDFDSAIARHPDRDATDRLELLPWDTAPYLYHVMCVGVCVMYVTIAFM